MLTTLVFGKIFKQKSVCSRLLVVAPLPDLGTVRFVHLFSSEPNSKLYVSFWVCMFETIHSCTPQFKVFRKRYVSLFLSDLESSVLYTSCQDIQSDEI